ncbi:MAG: hypothetical protein JWN65_2668 [Solirubrobacterales bacterium]|nr:hypothetical protein [Solirubrobacterales bacterium]
MATEPRFGVGALATARAVAQRVGAESFSALEPAELAELHRILRKLAGFDAAQETAPR